MHLDQAEYQVRLEWGEMGVKKLSPISDVTIIVDVLSFSTAVDVAVSRHAQVYPYRWKDESAIEFAKRNHLLMAQFKRSKTRYSLSPTSLSDLPAGASIVLPSPNGSTLCQLTKSKLVLTASLRNARSVADYVRENSGSIAIIPAGEKWPDQTLRPAFEDLMGAGAVLAYLRMPNISPECKTALALFNDCQKELLENIRTCQSGKELETRGFLEDVVCASDLNASQSIPILKNGSFVDQANL